MAHPAWLVRQQRTVAALDILAEKGIVFSRFQNDPRPAEVFDHCTPYCYNCSYVCTDQQKCVCSCKVFSVVTFSLLVDQRFFYFAPNVITVPVHEEDFAARPELCTAIENLRFLRIAASQILTSLIGGGAAYDTARQTTVITALPHSQPEAGHAVRVYQADARGSRLF